MANGQSTSLLSSDMVKRLGEMRNFDIHQYSSNAWHKWYEEFHTHINPGFHFLSNRQKVSVLLTKMGPECYEILKSLDLDDNVDFDDLIKCFNEYFHPLYARWVFYSRKQGDSESFDDFAFALSILSYACQFGRFQGAAVRDIFVSNIHPQFDHIRKLCIKQNDPTLTEVLVTARTVVGTETLIDSHSHEDVSNDLNELKLNDAEPAHVRPTNPSKKEQSIGKGSSNEIKSNLNSRLSKFKSNANGGGVRPPEGPLHNRGDATTPKSSAVRGKKSPESDVATDREVTKFLLAYSTTKKENFLQKLKTNSKTPQRSVRKSLTTSERKPKSPKPPAPLNQVIAVTVVYISEDNDIAYVCLSDGIMRLCSIEMTLKAQLAQSLLKPADNIRVGAIYGAPWKDGWYRAQLLSLDPRKPVGRVRFIDYGNHDDVLLSDFKALPAKLLIDDPVSFPIVIPRGAPPFHQGEDLNIKLLSMNSDDSWSISLENPSH